MKENKMGKVYGFEDRRMFIYDKGKDHYDTDAWFYIMLKPCFRESGHVGDFEVDSPVDNESHKIEV